MQNANKKTGSASTIYALPVDATRGNRIPCIFALNPCFSYVPACIIALGAASCKACKIGIWLCPTKEMQNKMQNGYFGINPPTFSLAIIFFDASLKQLEHICWRNGRSSFPILDCPPRDIVLFPEGLLTQACELPDL